MNSLSWLLYLADVSSSIKMSLWILSFVILIASGILWLVRANAASIIYDYDMPSNYSPKGSEDYKRWKIFKDKTEEKMLYILPIVFILISDLIPSTRTIYMIAASEIGEKVVTSPNAVEMLNDLKIIIKNRLKEEVEGKRKKGK